MWFAFAKFMKRFRFADTPAPVKHNKLAAFACVTVFKKLQFLFSANEHILP